MLGRHRPGVVAQRVAHTGVGAAKPGAAVSLAITQIHRHSVGPRRHSHPLENRCRVGIVHEVQHHHRVSRHAGHRKLRRVVVGLVVALHAAVRSSRQSHRRRRRRPRSIHRHSEGTGGAGGGGIAVARRVAEHVCGHRKGGRAGGVGGYLDGVFFSARHRSRRQFRELRQRSYCAGGVGDVGHAVKVVNRLSGDELDHHRAVHLQIGRVGDGHEARSFGINHDAAGLRRRYGLAGGRVGGRHRNGLRGAHRRSRNRELAVSQSKRNRPGAQSGVGADSAVGLVGKGGCPSRPRAQRHRNISPLLSRADHRKRPVIERIGRRSRNHRSGGGGGGGRGHAQGLRNSLIGAAEGILEGALNHRNRSGSGRDLHPVQNQSVDLVIRVGCGRKRPLGHRPRRRKAGHRDVTGLKRRA